MSLQSLVDNLTSDTLRVSLPLFRPELIICATIVVMLLVRIFRFGQRDRSVLARARRLVRRVLVRASRRAACTAIGDVQRQEIFTGMLVYDSMTVFFRMFLLAFAFWFIILVRHDRPGRPARRPGFLHAAARLDARHVPDGVGQPPDDGVPAVEMASVPSYVMAGIIKGRRRASEASLKYAVYGAGAAGVMLYGISLLAGLLGSAHLPTIAAKLAAMDIPGHDRAAAKAAARSWCWCSPA